MKFTDVGKRQNAVFVPVDLIVPDPDQPRKNFDEFEIEQLGVSLLHRQWRFIILLAWQQLIVFF